MSEIRKHQTSSVTICARYPVGRRTLSQSKLDCFSVVTLAVSARRPWVILFFSFHLYETVKNKKTGIQRRPFQSQLSLSGKGHHHVQSFQWNMDTAAPAERNSDLQALICVLVAIPRWCPTLSNPVPWFWFWQIIHSPPRGGVNGGGALQCVCGRRQPGQLRLEGCCGWLFHHMGRKRVPVSYGSNEWWLISATLCGWRRVVD